MDRMRVDLPHLSEELDRFGNIRCYVRRFGRRIRIRGIPGSPAFLEAYRAALEALGGDGRRKAAQVLAPAPDGSLAWLGTRYFESPEFRKLDPKSQATRRLILEGCFRELWTDGTPMGQCPLAAVTPAKVKRLRDAKADKPGAANNRRKYLSSLFGWGVEAGLMQSNPARDVKKIKYATDGFRTWRLDEVAQFEAHYPPEHKARIALALLMFTGVRRCDLVRLGWQHIRDGWLKFVPGKTEYRRLELLELPILPQLAAALERCPRTNLTFVTTEQGKPFTAAGFGGWWRERCDDAGLPECAAHGLRKLGATIAAENGATVHQLMAIFGWTTPSQAMVYTRKAEKKKMASDAMHLVSLRDKVRQP